MISMATTKLCLAAEYGESSNSPHSNFSIFLRIPFLLT
jgi:hypothetical protein